MKVYARVWFCIKTKPSCKYGALRVWEMIHFSRYLNESLKKIIDPVIQRNAYFSDPDNLLLCMISDDRPHIRELGPRRILIAKHEQTSTSVRCFTVPILNLNSSDYTDIINWKDCSVTVPPMLSNIPEEQLKCLITGHASELLAFESFPCHTQSVEMCVKLVTEAAATECGEFNRDGFKRARMQSRELMP